MNKKKAVEIVKMVLREHWEMSKPGSGMGPNFADEQQAVGGAYFEFFGEPITDSPEFSSREGIEDKRLLEE